MSALGSPYAAARIHRADDMEYAARSLLRIRWVMKTRITLIRVVRPTCLAQTWICRRVWLKWKWTLDCHHEAIQLDALKTSSKLEQCELMIKICASVNFSILSRSIPVSAAFASNIPPFAGALHPPKDLAA